ncbi:hypothetical protein HBP99_04165 [Listeria booriae]|uniref:hypothetical protein n=1 Tax=Listeria booriae TaxID=1552123 RepID=UPI001626C5E9|nr:hypothetical protein [Listeria booriae]MBC2367814.1 hypothetical protein [Listeria booriae]
MKRQLTVKEEYFATTKKEAEELINEAKEDKHLTKQSIIEKSNKNGEYFQVDIEFKYNTARGLMEVE